jgi:hypothetical protein
MGTKRPARRYALGAIALMIALAAPLLSPRAQAQTTGSIEVISPTAGEQITTDDIEVQVEVSDFDVDCTKAGMANEDGVGHIHVMVDGMTMDALANFYCSDTFTISGEGLTPGTHTLIVDLATNDHLDWADTVQQVEFDYQPQTERPLPEPNDQGEPGVELVSPTDGATVPSKFEVEVAPVNFEPSEGLEGKGNVDGYGHYHVFVDTPGMSMMMMEGEGTPEGEMEMEGTPEDEMEMMATPEGTVGMAMHGMILMPGTDTFELDLSAWGPGEHTIWIEPVRNDHHNFESSGHVEFTVTVEEET